MQHRIRFLTWVGHQMVEDEPGNGNERILPGRIKPPPPYCRVFAAPNSKHSEKCGRSFEATARTRPLFSEFLE